MACSLFHSVRFQVGSFHSPFVICISAFGPKRVFTKKAVLESQKSSVATSTLILCYSGDLELENDVRRGDQHKSSADSLRTSHAKEID